MMLRLFWMMFGAPALAAAFRADIMSDTNSSGGDEMCCCYKEKQAYRNICVKDGMAYWPHRGEDKDKIDYYNFTYEFLTYWELFNQKSPLNRRLYLTLTPLTSVDTTSSPEKLKLWGFWYRKLPDDQKYVKANDLFSAGQRDNYEIPEPMENGHPIWSRCGGPELEPMTLYTLADGEDTKPAPSECLKKETLKKNFAGLRVCPEKMTRFFCDCKNQC